MLHNLRAVKTSISCMNFNRLSVVNHITNGCKYIPAWPKAFHGAPKETSSSSLDICVWLNMGHKGSVTTSRRFEFILIRCLKSSGDIVKSYFFCPLDLLIVTYRLTVYYEPNRREGRRNKTTIWLHGALNFE